MKKPITLLFTLCFCSFIIGQVKLPEGVTGINGSGLKTSFLMKDRNNNLWQGLGALAGSGTQWANLGLKRYSNNSWQTTYANGTFTDAAELGNDVYFTAFDGLYTFDGNSFNINNSITGGTCMAIYKSNLMIGTFGSGLFQKNGSGYSKVSVVVNGRSYDSIYSLDADSKLLYIGTTDGLIVYDGSSFNRYILPYKSTGSSFGDKFLKSVISIKSKGNGHVWVLNNNFTDTAECLYIFENGNFSAARNQYSAQCIGKKLIPYSAKKLARDIQGNIIVGTGWGVLEFGSDSIRNYFVTLNDPFNSFNVNFPGNLKNAKNFIAECDQNGDIYCNSLASGLFKIHPATYSNTAVFYDPLLSYGTIDINEIKTSVTNTGINFQAIDDFNPTRNLPVFNVPNLGCAKAMFSAAIWMGGTETGSGDLHLAAETYRQRGNDFRPGPIDLVTLTYDSTASSVYNRIWKINRQTIDEFKANRTDPFYIIPKEILDWPAHGTGNFSKNLAPFVDVDKNGIYEPVKGDYPAIKGDQMLWWVFNDLGTHGESTGIELGVEVHGSCYAYYYRDIPTTDSNAIINRTLFFDYKIINRSNKSYKDFYAGIWNDVDLGNYADDYVGCDVQNNTGYGYNGDNIDEGNYGFGKNPPVIFCKLLNHPISAFVAYNNNADPINGNPVQDLDFYNFMRGKWQNGNSIMFGGNGVSGNISTPFMFDGNTYPATSSFPCWTEKSAGNPSGDRRFIMSSNAAELGKDSVFDLEFAYILLHDPNTFIADDPCTMKKDVLGRVQNWYNKKSFPSRPYYGASVASTQITGQQLTVFPNPANAQLNLRSDVINADVISLQIFSGNGELIDQISLENNENPMDVAVDISSFPIGLYLIKANTKKGMMTRKLVIER